MNYYGLNRYICNVLDEIRTCHETRNYSILISLIEEAQTMVNRMESALQDSKDIQDLLEEKSKLKKEVKELTKKVEGLKTPLEKLEK